MDSLAFAFGAFVLAMGAVLDAGVIISAQRAGFPRPRWTRLAIGLTVGLDAWFGLTLLLAWLGVFRDFEHPPPRVPLALLTAVAAVVLASRTDGFRLILGGCPPWYPVALQTFRVVVEVALWQLYRAGRIPVQMTFEGWNYDVLVGLSAPLVAWAVARGAIGSRGLLVWNLLSLGLLANIVIVANRSAPGPFHAAWAEPPNTVIGEAPYIWLPVFLVPLAFFGHFVSLLQLRVARRRDAAATTSR